MDASKLAKLIVDSLCLGRVNVGLGVSLRPPKVSQLSPRFSSPRPMEFSIDLPELGAGLDVIPGNDYWLVLRKISLGEAIYVEGYRIRLHQANPLPRVVVFRETARDPDSLLLEWDPEFRPTIDLDYVPARLDPAIHSMRMDRLGLLIQGGAWHKRIDW